MTKSKWVATCKSNKQDHPMQNPKVTAALPVSPGSNTKYLLQKPHYFFWGGGAEASCIGLKHFLT